MLKHMFLFESPTVFASYLVKLCIKMLCLKAKWAVSAMQTTKWVKFNKGTKSETCGETRQRNYAYIHQKAIFASRKMKYH